MDEIRVIFWGPSERVIVSTLELKSQVMGLMDLLKENLMASQQIAQDYLIEDKLESLGLNLLDVEELVIEMLQAGWKQLIF